MATSLTRLESSSKLKTASFNTHYENIGLRSLGNDFYTLEGRSERFPFKAYKYPGGNYIWLGTDLIDGNQVLSIVRMAAKYKQSVHINTGTHGSKNGETAYTKYSLAEKDFTIEDFETALKHYNVSIHVVSKYSPAIYPNEANQIINAWCDSITTREMIPPEGYFKYKKVKYIANPSMYNKISSQWKKVNSEITNRMFKPNKRYKIYVDGKKHHHFPQKYWLTARKSSDSYSLSIGEYGGTPFKIVAEKVGSAYKIYVDGKKHHHFPQKYWLTARKS
ncbi:MAG: hypothetical protein AAF443_05135, partial [Chlamydiota bacterium]